MVAQTQSAYLPIEDYGMIGDLYTVALVSKYGSIDWCCLPDFDSPSVFCALLDAQKGGSFRLHPINLGDVHVKQMYVPETNILVTRFMGATGIGEITDFMPIKQPGSEPTHHQVIRSVHMVYGSLSFQLSCQPAFNYARDTHQVQLSEHGALFQSPNLTLALSSSIPLQENAHHGVEGNFTLSEGQSAFFALTSTQDAQLLPLAFSEAHYDEQFKATKHYWQGWLSKCSYQGRWREYVHRSALALKLLTYAPTGAIVAAPTTSLPEGIGGERNWDYRFTWFRDAAFTIDSLLALGFTAEADAFVTWVNARVDSLQGGGTLQPMYTIHGGHEMPEIHLDHLEGYRHSKPVRIGNGAATQKQLDIYGELMDTIFLYSRNRGIGYDGWLHICTQLEWLSQHWHEADEGIWEVRGEPKQFLHSRLTSWIAFDRAIRIARERGFPAPLEQWQQTSMQIYNEIIEKGWNKDTNSFVQYYGGTAVDASALLLSLTGFLTGHDRRMLSTIDHIQRELTHSPHVYRYDIDKAANDGLTGHEGSFNICSFWRVEALVLANRVSEAQLALEQLLTYANHVGLYSEEISPTGEALGNFPQAFTHLALIHACLSVNDALNNVFPHLYHSV